MLIVSFATPKYEEELMPLLKGLREYDIPHHIELFPGKGTWQKNNHYKADFIYEKLQRYQQPIVWLDADTEIRQYPDLFNTLKCDIAVNYFKGKQLCGGVMYFDYSPAAFTLIQLWQEENARHPDRWESDNLDRAIEKMMPHITIHQLPREYCTFDLCTDQSNPVLWSRQASRIHKEAV
jgi:hypothetical protein